jgi:hypothetical protein
LDITEGNNQQTTTFTVIKIEQNVSCVPMFIVMHISYKLYTGLSDCVSVCPCDTNILLYKMDFEQFLRK